MADTHLFHSDLDVPDGDVLVHAGDLLRGGTLKELDKGAAFLASLPHPHKIFVAGNHDRCFEELAETSRERLPRSVTYLEDAETTIDGVRFWGSPWQPWFHDWAFNLRRGEALAAKWALVPEGIDVLVTHGPPLGFGDRSSLGASRQGCADLLARVRAVRPLLHLFGHIHEDGGVWQDGGTCFANVTTWECELSPRVFDVDVAARTVREVETPRRRPLRR